MSPAPCIDVASAHEALYRIDLGPGETLRATVTMPGFDPVLYVVDNCDGRGRVLACADGAGRDAPEFLRFTGAAEPTTVYLVVDGFRAWDEGPFALTRPDAPWLPHSELAPADDEAPRSPYSPGARSTGAPWLE